MIWVFVIGVASTILFLVLRYSFLFPEVKGIPILMYHDLSLDRVDFLTIAPADFAAQLSWLREQGYRSLSMADFLAHVEGKIERSQLPVKPVLITFDDGYTSNVELALPLLRKFDFRATLFVTSGYVDERESGSPAGAKYLSLTELRKWVESGMELALHSHSHPNYRSITVQDVLMDLEQEEARLRQWELPYHRALAYPFGARPKSRAQLNDLKAALKRFGIQAAFRIGNRVQTSTDERYEINRIDIRGDQSFFEFKIKVRKGRTKRL